VLLRRLACPYARPQLDPAQPGYNPYITVDYIDNDAPQPGGVQLDPKLVTFDGVTSIGGVPRTRGDAYAACYSVGRTQPYAAAFQLSQAPVPPPGPPPTQPWHTFGNATTPGRNLYLANSQAQANTFDWLVHLDRQLVSPMELL